MGVMKELDIRIRSGGDDAVAAAGELMAHLTGEIHRLREAIRRLADQDATLSVQGGNVIVEMDPPCPYVTGTVTRYCTLTPFTLTAAEREAVWFALAYAQNAGHECEATLRGLLERTK